MFMKDADAECNATPRNEVRLASSFFVGKTCHVRILGVLVV